MRKKHIRRNSGGAVNERFLSREEVEVALDEVSALAERSGVQAALAGGVALQAYGSTRFTVDVAVVASGPIRGLRRLEPLTFGGYSSVTSAGTAVDVIIRDDEYENVFDFALDRSGRRSGIPLRVTRPEHLAVMKMIAGRGKDEVDLQWLIASGTVDTTKTERVVRKLLGHYAATHFRNFAKETAWLKSQGRL